METSGNPAKPRMDPEPFVDAIEAGKFLQFGNCPRRLWHFVVEP